jgi:hypothetical protein
VRGERAALEGGGADNGAVVRTRWWSRTRGIPDEVYAAWAASLRRQPGRQVRVLAWATTPDGHAISSPSVLSFTTNTGSGSDSEPNADAPVDSEAWVHLGWHEIERGGWDEETGELSWTRYAGSPGSVTLTEPGRLPEVFRERVAASIVLEKFVPIRNGRGVLLSGRRDLADGDVAIIWNSSLGRGLTWQMEGVQEATDEAIAQVRREYDMG